MSPYIDENCFVVAEPLGEGKRAKPGEVLIYKADWQEAPILHMVWGTYEDGYRMTGKNNARSDSGFIKDCQILGVVRNVYRFGEPTKVRVNR